MTKIVKCPQCGGEYQAEQRDGTLYVHTCAPKPDAPAPDVQDGKG